MHLGQLTLDGMPSADMYPNMSPQEFVHFEDENYVPISYVPSEEEIWNLVCPTPQEDNDADEEEVVHEIIPRISYEEVSKAMKMVEHFLMQQENGMEGTMQIFRSLEKDMVAHNQDTLYQSSIIRYFSSDK